MNVFISWSGESSQIVGLALKDWLPSVIQSVEPFISSEDIAKGSRWFSEIGVQLEKSNFGIICLTPENYNEPWILFESGAISRSIGESYIAPILLGMSISELEGPLAQFNATLASKEEILKLIKSINERIDNTKEKKLETKNLEKIFEALWPELEGKIHECQEAIIRSKSAKHETKTKRKMDDILEELIETNRSNARLIAELPSRMQKELSYGYPVEALKKSKYKQYSDLKIMEMQMSEHLKKVKSEMSMISSNIEDLNKEIVLLRENNNFPSDIKRERLLMLDGQMNQLKCIYTNKMSEVEALNKNLYNKEIFDTEFNPIVMMSS